MYEVKKQWGARRGLPPPEAVLLEDANGTSLSDGSTPEEMGWTIASPSDPPRTPICTVYVVLNEDWEGWYDRFLFLAPAIPSDPPYEFLRGPASPIVAQPLAAENPAVPSLAPA